VDDEQDIKKALIGKTIAGISSLPCGPRSGFPKKTWVIVIEFSDDSKLNLELTELMDMWFEKPPLSSEEKF